mmetsp:Transcript_8821/g.14325  ORF Transcript_8821/g.14325 Transcript_8821/m.14325 type:complete len:353 (-) Transcript_8821:402-1460(-)|eukprot:CAMPEP_0203745930 /NCGR_PEP_ID=MMETSP0098-20131031/1523_1 /ASSEMBLY_ACC=CAM_ASM_000208 /TAXON_ID=96639 /ORGANISM=" , Strain NY0313808BC1" /LENGTH=352 /DNA_ID=CAMNT_0050633855 /DNA_START=40 /DNA_END=1098 /DNA_ORIENTATION=+
MVDIILSNALEHMRVGDYHQAVACLERGILELEVESDKKLVRARLTPLMEKMQQDPYFTLQCDPETSRKDIRRKYLCLARSFHPDKSQGTLGLFQVIQGAFEKLFDPNYIDFNKTVDLRVVATNENCVTWSWKAHSSSSGLVRYDIQYKDGSGRVKKKREARARFQLSVCCGIDYRVRVRTGVASHGKRNYRWGPYSEWKTYFKGFKPITALDVSYDSSSSCILKWAPAGCYQVEWRGVDKDTWHGTNPSRIFGSQCRKKNLARKGLGGIIFRVRPCVGNYTGDWKSVILKPQERDISQEVLPTPAVSNHEIPEHAVPNQGFPKVEADIPCNPNQEREEPDQEPSQRSWYWG